MALSKLSGDEQGILFVQLCNVLDPGIAVALASVSNELRTATRAPLQQLKTGHEAAAALCRKLGHRNCKELREAKEVCWCHKGLTADELKLLGTLGSVLPALERLDLCEPAAGPDGVQQLAAGLGAGALPAVTELCIIGTHVGDAGASALAAALGQGALPRLKSLALSNAAIGDAGLVALAPALRRLPALERLVSSATRSATRASPPSWRRRRRQVRRRRRREGWRSSRCSTSAAPRSPTPAAPPSPLRSTAARCRRSRSSICTASLPAPRRRPPCMRRAPTWRGATNLPC